MLSERLDKNSAIPLYYQIKEHVKEQVETDQLKPGSRLPTEQWYKDYYGVSRVTVRRALVELKNDGIITDRKIVSHPQITRRLNRLEGFQEEMKKSGRSSSSKIIEYQQTAASGDIARIMRLTEGARLHYIYRIRYIDNKPCGLQKLYLNEAACRGLDPVALENNSLYDLAEQKYGVAITEADQTISVSMPTRAQMKLLDIRASTPLLLIKRTTYMQGKEVFEYTESLYLSNLYKCCIRLYR